MACSAPVTIGVFLCDMKPTSNLCVPSTFAIKPTTSKQNNWTKVAMLPSLGRRRELAFVFSARKFLVAKEIYVNESRPIEINRTINAATGQGVKE